MISGPRGGTKPGREGEAAETDGAGLEVAAVGKNLRDGGVAVEVVVEKEEERGGVEAEIATTGRDDWMTTRDQWREPRRGRRKDCRQ